MNFLKINKFLSTFNLVVIIIGYPLITSLFLSGRNDIEGVSQTITIPYRIFALGIMVLVLLLNLKSKVGKPSFPLYVLLLFWFFWIYRMVYDIYISTDVFLADTSQLWLFVFGICLPALFSVYKSINYIETEKVIKWCYWGLTFILILTLFSNQALISNTDNEYRVNANIALNTISYGNIGVTAFLMSVFLLLKRNDKLFIKIVYVLIAFLAFYSVLRAGSRGPIINLLIAIILWIFSKQKKLLLGIFIIIIIAVLFSLFYDSILTFMGKIAPVIEIRLRDTIEGKEVNERSVIYSAAIEAFSENPIFGKQFAIFNNDGSYTYAHNIILDSLMGLGLVGGIMIFYLIFSFIKSVFYSVRYNKDYMLLGLIFIQQLSSSMFSGAFYKDQVLVSGFVFIFLKTRNIILEYKA